MHICGAGAEPFALMHFGCIRHTPGTRMHAQGGLGDAAEAHHRLQVRAAAGNVHHASDIGPGPVSAVTGAGGSRCTVSE